MSYVPSSFPDPLSILELCGYYDKSDELRQYPDDAQDHQAVSEEIEELVALGHGLRPP